MGWRPARPDSIGWAFSSGGISNAVKRVGARAPGFSGSGLAGAATRALGWLRHNHPRTVDGTDGVARRPRRIRGGPARSEEHTSELQSLMRISYAVFCLKKKKKLYKNQTIIKKQLL